MAKPRMDLSAFVGKLLEEQDGDVLREGIRVLSQALMETEVAGLGLLLTVLLLQAQAPPPPAAPVVSISRSWYVEAAVVAVMFGLALFAVCRSSRRN